MSIKNPKPGKIITDYNLFNIHIVRSNGLKRNRFETNTYSYRVTTLKQFKILKPSLTFKTVYQTNAFSKSYHYVSIYLYVACQVNRIYQSILTLRRIANYYYAFFF